MKPPFPPFTHQSALLKVKSAENVWNTRDPDQVIQAYTEDSIWRNRNSFLTGRKEIHAFLTQKWEKELQYKLSKELWIYSDTRIAVRFEYEWHDHAGQWYRSYGNENWEFNSQGYMHRRFASINDLLIEEQERTL